MQLGNARGKAEVRIVRVFNSGVTGGCSFNVSKEHANKQAELFKSGNQLAHLPLHAQLQSLQHNIRKTRNGVGTNKCSPGEPQTEFYSKLLKSSRLDDAKRKTYHKGKSQNVQEIKRRCERRFTDKLTHMNYWVIDNAKKRELFSVSFSSVRFYIVKCLLGETKNLKMLLRALGNCVSHIWQYFHTFPLEQTQMSPYLMSTLRLWMD